MLKYEYKTKLTVTKGFLGGQVDLEAFDKMLNEMGQDGWELVDCCASNQSYGETRYVLSTFKRTCES